jgi:hypothetical protein
MAAQLDYLELSLLARQYVANGWALVPIPSGKKFPTAKGWNKPENCVRTPAQCARIKNNVGIAHRYSHTCVLDFDDLAKAAEWLVEHGLDFDALWNHPKAVRISSGRPNRGKLLFQLPVGVESLRTHQFHDYGLELRCASGSGATMQDVLPPSLHPLTGNPYAWEYADPSQGSWRNPPVLPADMLAVWEELSTYHGGEAGEAGNSDAAGAREALAQLDPDAGYSNWVEVGMALHHEFAGAYEGLELWDDWSSQGAKYLGIEDLEKHWYSFDADREGARVTLESLRADIRNRPIDPDEFAILVDEPMVETMVEGLVDDLSDILGGPEPAPEEGPSGLPATADEFDNLDAPDAESEAPVVAAKKPAGFVFQSLDEFLHRAPPSWIIKGLLPRASLGVMYGDSGAGKTFVALDQAMAIARGQEWRGARTKQGTVAYIAAEGATGLQDRITAYCRQHDVDPAGVPIRVLDAAPNMMDNDKKSKGGVLALGRALKALGPLAVVYVDTYARVMGAGNENEAKDTNTVVANCHLLHQVTGAIIMLIHHSGKDSARGARGSGALRAAADVEYSVTKAAAHRTVKVTKMKDGEDGREYRFKLANVTVGMDEDGDTRTSCVVEHLTDAPTVAEQMGAQQEKPRSEVQARILCQLATYIAGDVEREAFIQDVRAITPLPSSGIENHNWKALITKPLDRLIRDGAVIEVSGRLSLPKTASE